MVRSEQSELGDVLGDLRKQCIASIRTVASVSLDMKPLVEGLADPDQLIRALEELRHIRAAALRLAGSLRAKKSEPASSTAMASACLDGGTRREPEE